VAKKSPSRVASELTTLAVTVGDWDSLSADGRRDLIRAVIRRVAVAPGKGAGRITIEPHTE